MSRKRKNIFSINDNNSKYQKFSNCTKVNKNKNIFIDSNRDDKNIFIDWNNRNPSIFKRASFYHEINANFLYNSIMFDLTGNINFNTQLKKNINDKFENVISFCLHLWLNHDLKNPIISNYRQFIKKYGIGIFNVIHLKKIIYNIEYSGSTKFQFKYWIKIFIELFTQNNLKIIFNNKKTGTYYKNTCFFAESFKNVDLYNWVDRGKEYASSHDRSLLFAVDGMLRVLDLNTKRKILFAIKNKNSSLNSDFLTNLLIRHDINPNKIYSFGNGRLIRRDLDITDCGMISGEILDLICKGLNPIKITCDEPENSWNKIFLRKLVKHRKLSSLANIVIDYITEKQLCDTTLPSFLYQYKKLGKYEDMCDDYMDMYSDSY